MNSRDPLSSAIHINPDHYLHTEAGRVYTHERSKLAWEQAYAELDSALGKKSARLYLVFGVQGAGKSSWIRAQAKSAEDAVFFDAALPARKHRARALTIAGTHGVPVTAVWINAKLESALKRNANRRHDERVPEEAVRNVYAMLEPPSYEEGFDAILHIDAEDVSGFTYNPATVTIRPADSADLPAIATILVDTWRRTFDGLLAPSFLDNLNYQQQQERHRKVMSNNQTLYYVAENQNKDILGFINAGPDRTSANARHAEIYAIYIRTEYQGSGIGHRLVHAAATTLAAQGKQSLRVWALSNNPFRFFYQRLGGQAGSSLAIELGGEQYTQDSFVWPDLSQLIKQSGI